MVMPYEQLDRRFELLRPLLGSSKPSRGWIKAIREALGMTTAQLGRRMGVSQSRIPELERDEARGKISLSSLERAAEQMGCSVIYVLVPHRPIGETLKMRAEALADRQLAQIDQTMKLEDQAVSDSRRRRAMREEMVSSLLKKPARLWDEV